MKDHETPPKDRILAKAAEVFAQKGFGGATIRAICAAADVSPNMIHHYFGSKQALFDTLLEEFGEHVFEVPLRVINTTPTNVEDFKTRFKIFFEDTISALITHRHTYELAAKEKIVLPGYDAYFRELLAFLKRSQDAGILRETLDCEMITGVFIDRIGPQLVYAEQMQNRYGDSILIDGAYRRRWVDANIDLFLSGMVEGR